MAIRTQLLKRPEQVKIVGSEATKIKNGSSEEIMQAGGDDGDDSGHQGQKEEEKITLRSKELPQTEMKES